MQWVFDTDGPDCVALCSTVIRYRAKGALRDVGKALRLPDDLIKMLPSQVGLEHGMGRARSSDRFASRDEARRELFAYLESYYNRRRLHSALGYRTPEQAEQLAA
mgnify:CR=1 FL=1